MSTKEKHKYKLTAVKVRRGEFIASFTVTVHNPMR
jgi:hypothetical protein